MKKLLSVFLVCVILSQVFVNVGIGVYYHINKAYITQQLCENKSNPKLHCNGHCYLSKQLKKAEENESKSVQFIKEKQEIISNETKTLSANYFVRLKAIEYPLSDSHLYHSGNEQSLLKPPTV